MAPLAGYGPYPYHSAGPADFVVDRGDPLRDLITYTFRLDQAVEAYNVFARGRTGKVVLVGDSGDLPDHPPASLLRSLLGDRDRQIRVC